MERLWSRAVATGGNRWHSGGRENGEIKRKPFPWVATGCVRRSMVRRGSTVRVRQRALQTARKSDLYFRIDLQVVERGQVWSPLEDNSLRLLIQAARCVRLSRKQLDSVEPHEDGPAPPPRAGSQDFSWIDVAVLDENRQLPRSGRRPPRAAARTSLRCSSSTRHRPTCSAESAWTPSTAPSTLTAAGLAQ